MKFQGPLPRPLISGAPCSNKDKDRRSRSKAKDKPGQDKHKRKHKGTSRTKDKARQGKPRQAQAKLKLQTSRGNLHLSESDWGGFLLKFDLGPHVASLVMSASLSVKLFMCGDGGSASFGMTLQGPLRRSHLRRALLQQGQRQKKQKQSQGQARPRQAQAKTRAQAEARTRQGKVSQDKPKQSANFKRKPSPV